MESKLSLCNSHTVFLDVSITCKNKKYNPLNIIVRSTGTVLLKTNLLEVLEDHLFVFHLEPTPVDDMKQVCKTAFL